MAKVLVSNNSELLRHFAGPAFKHLRVDILVASSGPEALDLFLRHEPSLAVLEAELPMQSGYEVCRAIKNRHPGAKIILVAGKRLTGEQMQRVSGSGCDELLIAPMTADELHDVVALQLGHARPGTERFQLDCLLEGQPLDAAVANLSLDGLRLTCEGPQAAALTEGLALTVVLRTDETSAATQISAHIVWVQQHQAKAIAGVAFDALSEPARMLLAKLTQWQIITDHERTRVVLRGDFTEATKFDELLPLMVGRVVFDLAEVTYMNSLGVRAWCEFLRRAQIQAYEFHACSVPFVMQAAMVPDVVGRGTVTSFFAPYHCDSCGHQEERLLQSAAILAAGLTPPTFSCPSCSATLSLDDLPERYFAFLPPAHG